MLRIFATEKFKEITFDERLKFRYAISNFGRLISFTDSFTDGRIIKGSTAEGYRLFRYKLRKGDAFESKHFFYYKLVAENFLKQKTEDHVYVIHLDHNRQNDVTDNLKWVTKEERTEHHKTSPMVIEAKKRLVQINKTRNHKLSSTDVIRIKKILFDPNRKTRLKMVAKRFGITEMQVYRIKRGENWGHIKV